VTILNPPRWRVFILTNIIFYSINVLKNNLQQSKSFTMKKILLILLTIAAFSSANAQSGFRFVSLDLSARALNQTTQQPGITPGPQTTWSADAGLQLSLLRNMLRVGAGVQPLQFQPSTPIFSGWAEGDIFGWWGFFPLRPVAIAGVSTTHIGTQDFSPYGRLGVALTTNRFNIEAGRQWGFQNGIFQTPQTFVSMNFSLFTGGTDSGGDWTGNSRECGAQKMKMDLFHMNTMDNHRNKYNSSRRHRRKSGRRR